MEKLESQTFSALIWTLGWYVSSLCLSFYNKWLFDKDEHGFPFPLFTTSIQNLIQFFTALLILNFYPNLKPSSITTRNYIFKIIPCALVTAGDISLSNSSLMYITVFYFYNIAHVLYDGKIICSRFRSILCLLVSIRKILANTWRNNYNYLFRCIPDGFR